MKKSIGFKIWSTMVFTFIIFMLIFFLVNVTIFSGARDNYVYNQLEEAAFAKRNATFDREEMGESEEALWASHFMVDYDGEDYVLSIDQYTEAVYVKGKTSHVLTQIVEQVDLDKNSLTGSIQEADEKHYYYVDWLTADKAMIFLSTDEVDGAFDLRLLIVFIALLAISSISAELVSRKLTKPIKELEQFANDVAERKWDSKIPETDHDEIGKLAESLDQMRVALKDAEGKERQFLQSASHDLKTPVMIIKGYAQASIDNVEIESDLSIPETIKNEAIRLERRISQLLNYNTLDQTLEHKENRDIVQLDRLLNSLIGRFSVIAPTIQWEKSIDSVHIRGNSEALLIAFENIFDNQTRFAKSLVTTSLSEEGEYIYISIENDGERINNSAIDTLFDPYEKDKNGQFGLGLAIVNKVLLGHQGTIQAENTKRGVRFTATFKKEDI